MREGMVTRGDKAVKRDVKLVSVGNSKGIRLPKALLQKYGWGDSLVLEEVEDGVFLYGKETNSLSWKETYRAMAAEKEDWSDFDVTVADGVRQGRDPRGVVRDPERNGMIEVIPSEVLTPVD